MGRTYECSECLHVQLVSVIDNGLSGFADPNTKCENCGKSGVFFHAPGWRQHLRNQIDQAAKTMKRRRM